MINRTSVKYVCRFCAAAGATEDTRAPLFHNCHVCKAPQAMIPVGMHNKLIKLIATLETLYTQQDQALKAATEAEKFYISGRPRSTLMHLHLERVIGVLSDQHIFVEGWKGVQKYGDSEDAVNPKTGETVHFRTWLNRLIDRCPEAVQNHVGELREQAEPEEDVYTREELEDAYRAGFDYAQARLSNRVVDAIRPQPGSGWRRHTLQTGLGNFLKKLRKDVSHD